MKLKFSKISSVTYSALKNKNTSIITSVNDINVVAKMVHTGRVLSAEDVNRNRSSKYNYLAF